MNNRGGNNRAILNGERFGRLTVIEALPSHLGRMMWLCKCDCGNNVTLPTIRLRKKVSPTRSCGCLRRETTNRMAMTHGFSVGERIKKIFYKKWKGMRARCSDKTSKNYEYYGSRGIRVCRRWNDFNKFYDDMYESFLVHVGRHGVKQTTLDRINVDRGYNKRNCRWATWSTQVYNRRKL